MGLRSQLSWMVSGRAATQATLESLTRDLQALQQKVEQLSRQVEAMDVRQLDEFDKVRGAVADATDDLMARVEALRQQIKS